MIFTFYLFGKIVSAPGPKAWNSRNKKATHKHLGIKPLCLQVALNQKESGSRIVS
jgi:hypothetical protein